MTRGAREPGHWAAGAAASAIGMGAWDEAWRMPRVQPGEAAPGVLTKRSSPHGAVAPTRGVEARGSRQVRDVFGVRLHFLDDLLGQQGLQKHALLVPAHVRACVFV